MSLANTKKNAPLHAGFEWAGVVARVRRGAGSSRSSRRSALLSVLTSVYANASRGTGAASATAKDASTDRS